MGLRVTIRSAFNIHYPTDSSLLSDGVRVLTRTMKLIERALPSINDFKEFEYLHSTSER